MKEFWKSIGKYLFQPAQSFRRYNLSDLQPDLVSGLTVAVILLPQAIAFALIAELPPQMGLYAAIVAAIAGGLWGSAAQMHTGPTNALSLLVASTLLGSLAPGSGQFIVAAGLMAVMAGVLQMGLGFARLGVLVNFVSHSVIVGFATGAGVLIALKQLRPLFGLTFSGRHVFEILSGLAENIMNVEPATTVIGIGTILIILILRRWKPKLPGALIAMAIFSALTYGFSLNENGVAVIGTLPRSLPPIAQLPVLNFNLVANLSSGALAVGAIGLVQASAIARSIANTTGQRLDSNQEFIGQGLANIFAGVFSGYPVTASFTRSAVNMDSGARSPLAAIISSLFVLAAMFLLAPLAVYLPMAALAGVLIVTAAGLIDYQEILLIWRGAREDAAILLLTLFGTLFLRLDFAVLAGILLSFAIYIINTSSPRVQPVAPDENFRHFVPNRDGPQCPQFGVFEIQGDLYFGAVNHVEDVILNHRETYDRQRYLLLRMHNVIHCDFSGIHMLESLVKAYREKGGDIYMTRVQPKVLELMKTTGFYNYLGQDHFLSPDTAIEYIFYHVLDPAICIYESNVRLFKECQNLPRPDYVVEIPTYEIPEEQIEEIPARELWRQIRLPNPPLVIDVREPREFQQGHVPGAQILPLPKILEDSGEVPKDRDLVLVCRSGRRSTRAAQFLESKGYERIRVLQGGMQAWENNDLLEATET